MLKLIASPGYALLAVSLLAGCATNGQPVKQVQIDRISAEQLAALAPPAVAALSLEEVAAQCKQGKTDAEVIAAIKASDSRYALSASEVLEWHQKGISKGVLDYIQQANTQALQNAIADEMNKREQARVENEQKLKRERDSARLYSDPWFYGPGYGYGFGRPYWGYGFRRFYW